MCAASPSSLRRSPDPTWYFTGWGGDLTGTQNPGTVVMNVDRNVTGHFGRHRRSADHQRHRSGRHHRVHGVDRVDDRPPGDLPCRCGRNHGIRARIRRGHHAGGPSTRSSFRASRPSLPIHFKVSSENTLSLTAMSDDRGFVTRPSGGPGGPLVQIWYGDEQRFGGRRSPPTGRQRGRERAGFRRRCRALLQLERRPRASR